MSAMLCPLREGALRKQDAPALAAAGHVYTYAELDACVEEAARWFVEQGLHAGDVIAFTGEGGTDYLVAFLGAIRLGAVACPINPRFPDEYTRRLLGRVRATAVYGGNPAALNGEKVRNLELPAHGEGTRPMWTGEYRGPSPPNSVSLKFEENQPATLVFTSGSSGEPKAALHSIGNHLHSARLSNRNISLGPGDRWLLSLPLFHVAGIGVVFRCLMSGAAIAIPVSGARLVDAIRDGGATHISLVSTQLHRLLQTEEGVAALHALRAILLGGSGIPESLIRRAHALGLRIHTSYGMTEMASQVATTRPGDAIEKLFTSGAPLDRDSLRIAEDGEIQVRGKTLFLGYLDGSQLQRPHTADGWLGTGDVGQLDDDGYLRVTGRRDNMFVAGGENIQPEEIEAALCGCAGVIEAVVVPVSDTEFGAVPAAFVRCASGVPDEAALRRTLSSCLPRFKIPRRILPWPDEVAPVGIKPDRRALAAHAETVARLSQR